MSEQGTIHKPAPKNSTIPVKLLHDPTAKDGVIRLYAHMYWRYGRNKKNFEGQRSMADHLNVTEKTISTRIKELEYLDWLVVVERDFNPKTGSYTTPHYHLFLNQEDCRKFRTTYTPQDGEHVRPKPTVDEVKMRVSRAGKGNPSPIRPQPTTDNHQRNLGSDGQRKPSSDGQRNPGSDKLYSGYLGADADASSLSTSTPPSGDVGSDGKDSQPITTQYDRAARPGNRTDKQHAADMRMLAVARGSWGLQSVPEDKQACQRIGMIAGWLAKQPDVTFDRIQQFYMWYDKHNDGMARPKDRAKFADHWEVFVQQANGHATPAPDDPFASLTWGLEDA